MQNKNIEINEYNRIEEEDYQSDEDKYISS